MVLALFTWYLVTGRERIETWVPVNLEMTTLPENLVILDGMTTKLEVRVQAPKGLARSLSERNLTYPLDTGSLTVGENLIEFAPEELALSASYKVMEFKPSRLILTVDEMTTKQVPVVPRFTGELDDDFRLAELVADPAQVQLHGPKTILEGIEDITVPVPEPPAELPGIVDANVPLNLPDEVEVSPGQVGLFARFDYKTREIWVKVPLEIAAPEALSVRVPQDFVRLQIEGPEPLFRDNDFREDIRAVLQLNDLTRPGTYDGMDYTVTLPEGCRVIKRNPETLEVVVKAKDS